MADIAPSAPDEPRKQAWMDDKPGFTVRLTFDNHSRADDARHRFWSECLNNPATPPSDEDIERLEQRFRQLFPEALMYQVIEFKRKLQRSHVIQKNMEFTFKLDNLSYSSLFFDVSILGVTPFLKLFFNNPDVILALLDTSVPKAFNATVPFPIAQMPRSRVFPNVALEKAFQTADGVPVSDSKEEPSEKQGWAGVLQRAAQIPFLIPLVLSLAVLYVAASLINGERDRLKEREAALDARDKEVRVTNDARIAKLETLTLDLVRQLRAEKSSPASDAAAKNAPDPASSSP